MIAQEKSIRIYDTKKTFFGKIGSTLSKLFTPTQAGINNMLVGIKRSALIKNYKNMQKATDTKKENLEIKFQESYVLYLESIDQLIVDTIYKKVRTNKASDFEKDALGKYYNVIHIKDDDEQEYKLKKQEYLLQLDLNTLKEAGKTKLLEDYAPIYMYKVEQIYKSLLKHYSMKLTEKLTPADKEDAYNKIFKTLEDYVTNIVPMKKINDEDLMKEYALFEAYETGKLDQVDILDKRLILIGISRKLFVHSLPMIVAEKCYIKLLKDTRNLIVDTKIARKRENAYQLLLRIIEQYNDKLLKVKIYWDNNERKNLCIDFNQKRNKLQEESKAMSSHDIDVKKQILFIKTDLQILERYSNKYYRILQFYRGRLVKLGDIRKKKNKYNNIHYNKLKGQLYRKAVKNERQEQAC